MRNQRASVTAMIASLGLLTGAYLDAPPARDTPQAPDPFDGLTHHDRLELDLYHAEKRLADARTPGARRKARRAVEAIRAQLPAAPQGGEREG